MADVTGTIGTENVTLNNAATEATLRLLLQSSLATSKEQKAAIAQLAQKAGLDPAAVAAANQGLQQAAPSLSTFNKAAYTAGAAVGGMAAASAPFIALGKQLAAGNAQASDVFGALSTLPGPLGVVASGFQKLAAFQEVMLKQYQGMTNAGINFSGSLTDLRLAASNSYLTMEEFAGVMKANSETFAKMGGTANDGALAFSKLSNSLNQSGAGDELRALGYTSLEVNEGLAGYLANTGARTRQEMQNTSAITKGAAEYLTQLDGLATITGKSREEQEKALKQANANAAYEQMKMGMTESQRAAYDKGMAEMSAKFGKAGEDLFKSQAMGLPPMTEAAQKLAALSPEVAKASQGMADVGKRGGTAAETFKLSAQATEGAVKSAKRFENIAGAASMAGGALGESMMGITKESNRARAQGTETAAAGQKQQDEIARSQREREQTQAGEAAKTQKSLQELGQGIMQLVTPILNFFLPIMNSIIGTMAEYKNTTLSVIAAFVLWRGALAAKSLLGGGGAAGALASSAGGAAGRIPGTAGGVGGVAEGLGKIGPAMGSIGKGAGDLIKSFMQGIAGGLRAFANPMVVLGAAGFGLAIAAIGAGIAAASWILGKALPTLAEGLGKLGELDGAKLGSAAMGVGKLGFSLLAFGPFAVFGLPAAFAMNMLADGVVKLNSVDPAKLERVAAAMQKVKDATPSIGESISAGVAGLVNKVVGVSDSPAAGGKTASTAPANESKDIVNELQLLNKQITELLRASKETADHAKQGVSATKSLSGNLFNF